MRLRPYRTVNNVIDGVVITFEDISLLKKTELALKEKDEKFNSFAQLAPVGIFHADAEGKYIFVNDYWCQLTGLNAKQAKTNAILLSIHPEDQKRVEKAWTEVIKNQTPFTERFRLITPSGDVVNVKQKALPIGCDNKEFGYVGTLMDE